MTLITLSPNSVFAPSMNKFLLALLLLLPVVASAQPVFPPATQAEVNAGTVSSKFVSPATLANSTGGSNRVVVAAGANTTVTPSGSGGVMTYTVASTGGGSGGTNFPAVLNLRGGTNITVGSGTRQYWTLTTNATFNLNFQGTPLNGESVRFAVSNFSSSTIYMTNRQGGTIAAFYQPALGSNNSVLAIPPTSIFIADFVWSTNFNNGVVRQELQWMSQKEAALAVDTTRFALTTNADSSVIAIVATNVSGVGPLVGSNSPVVSALSAYDFMAVIATNVTSIIYAPGNSNVANLTIRVGVHHMAYATPLFFNANINAHNVVVTNRASAGNCTLVLTNTASGQDFQIVMLGEASGGTSRTITLVPDLGHLVANLDTFGTALATSFSFTLTNGNAVEISDSVRRQNGTNIHNIVSRQYAF